MAYPNTTPTVNWTAAKQNKKKNVDTLRFRKYVATSSSTAKLAINHIAASNSAAKSVVKDFIVFVLLLVVCILSFQES